MINYSTTPNTQYSGVPTWDPNLENYPSDEVWEVEDLVFKVSRLQTV